MLVNSKFDDNDLNDKQSQSEKENDDYQYEYKQSENDQGWINYQPESDSDYEESVEKDQRIIKEL